MAQTLARAAYYFVAGALICTGVIAILSIGVILLLIGIVMIVVGILRFGTRGLWAALLGGVVPMAILLNDIQAIAPENSPAVAQTYLTLALVFGAIALVGLVLGIVFTVRDARTPVRNRV